jgi:hypothetical protein
MRFQNVAALVLLFVFVASMSLAQQQRGDVELQFQGSYFQTVGTDFTIGSGNISAKIGPYVTDALQIGIGPTLTITRTSATTTTVGPPPTYVVTHKTESNTTTTFGSTAFLVYSILLRNAKAVPYFGAQYFKSDFSNTEDKGSIGINAGLKYYFAKKTAFDVSGNYLFTLNQDQQGGVILFAVGLSFLL